MARTTLLSIPVDRTRASKLTWAASMQLARDFISTDASVELAKQAHSQKAAHNGGKQDDSQDQDLENGGIPVG